MFIFLDYNITNTDYIRLYKSLKFLSNFSKVVSNVILFLFPVSLSRAFRSDGVATRVAIETRSIRYRDSSNLNTSCFCGKSPPRRVHETSSPSLEL